MASTMVRKRAFEMATDGKNPAMTIFWLKTREGFREKDREINLNVKLAQMPDEQVIDLGKEAIKFLEESDESDD